MSDPRHQPTGPYDPQPQPATVPPASVPPGHGPLEVPAAPSIEPIGVPAFEPGRSPEPGPSIDPGPAQPGDPQPRA